MSAKNYEIILCKDGHLYINKQDSVSFRSEDSKRFSESDIAEITKFFEKKPVSEDLEKEINKFFKDWGTDEINGGQYGINLDVRELKDIAHHFANWQKEHMMAKAVDGVVHHLEKCGVASVHYTDPIGAPMAYYISPEGLSAGDKVKIIVIKEN